MQQFKVDQDSGLEFLEVNNSAQRAVIFLHGYGASMYDLFPLHETLDHQKYNWYFLNAPLSLMPGQLMGRAWFPIDEQALQHSMMTGVHREFSEVELPELTKAVELVEKFIKGQGLENKKIILGGFSQGSMVCSHLLAKSTYQYTHAVLFSGTLIAKKILMNEGHKHKVDFFQSHGHQDQLLAYSQAKDLFEAMKLMGHQGEFISFEGGHEIPQAVLRKWHEFMSKV